MCVLNYPRFLRVLAGGFPESEAVGVFFDLAPFFFGAGRFTAFGLGGEGSSCSGGGRVTLLLMRFETWDTPTVFVEIRDVTEIEARASG